jgi:hypothetical protein
MLVIILATTGGGEKDGRETVEGARADTVEEKLQTESKTTKPQDKAPVQSGDKGAATPATIQSVSGSKKGEPSPEKKGEKPPTETAEAIELAESQATDSCKPLSAYPKFPWSEHLNSLVDAAGVRGVCELLDKSPKGIATVLADLPQFGPTGYDLIPTGELFQVFPEGRAERRSATIDFIFVDGKLFEIHFDYGFTSAEGLPPGLFDKALGEAVDTFTDPQERKIKRYLDGSLTVEQVTKKDKYNRTFAEIVFANKAIREQVQSEDKLRAQAKAHFETALGAFTERRYDKAIAGFQEAYKIIPSYGEAYVWEGVTLLRRDNFDAAAALASKALEVSRDKRVHSEAKGIMAVAALFGGKKGEALTLFQSAKDLDPINMEFVTSANELETGEYDPARVAKTAARMSCRKKNRKKSVGWSMEGILARGNFPSTGVYFDALSKAKKNPMYKREFKRWVTWECR